MHRHRLLVVARGVAHMRFHRQGLVLLLGLLVFATAIATGCRGISDRFVLHAQSLPITKTFTWDANPASEQVTSYTVRLDGVVIGTPATPGQPFTIATAGAHTLSVTAANVWGVGPTATLAFTVVLPSAPNGGRIQ